MKKILLILLLIVLVGCNQKTIEQPSEIIDEPSEVIEEPNYDIQDKEPINIYLFWGDGCGACANLKEFFNNLDSVN